MEIFEKAYEILKYLYGKDSAAMIIFFVFAILVLIIKIKKYGWRFW